MTHKAFAVLAGCVMAAASVSTMAARQLASRPADDWSARLERPDRIAGLRIDYVIESLALPPGATVADIGAGPGVLTLPLAKAVGPGKV